MKKGRLNLGKSLAKKVFYIQASIGVFFSLIFISNTLNFYSVLAGVTIVMIVNLVFNTMFFLFSGGKYIKQMIFFIFLGEIIKIFLTIALFVYILNIEDGKIDYAHLFIGYVFTYLLGMFLPFFIKGQVNRGLK